LLKGPLLPRFIRLGETHEAGPFLDYEVVLGAGLCWCNVIDSSSELMPELFDIVARFPAFLECVLDKFELGLTLNCPIYLCHGVLARF